MRPFLIVLLTIIVVANAQSCNSAQNVNSQGVPDKNSYWNSACTNPSDPYCPSTKCNNCDPGKILNDPYWMCDCLPNQYCNPDISSPTYATCTDFPGQIGSWSCSTYLDCGQVVYCANNPNGCIAFYWSCVQGSCSPCNQTYYGNTTTLCPGGDPYPLSSLQGETRLCGTNGWWTGNVGVGSTPSVSGISSLGPTTITSISTTMVSCSTTAGSHQFSSTGSKIEIFVILEIFLYIFLF